MIPKNLKRFAKPLKVLDHGYIMLVDVMGNDNAVAEAARVSYANGTKKVNNNQGLIRYLLRSGHTSPFEQAQIKLEVKLPIFVERQWARHRTASFNEISGRYSIMEDVVHQTAPDAWRLQAKDNKQGSAGALTNQWPSDWGVIPDNNEGAEGCEYGAWTKYREQYYTSPGEYLSEREIALHRLSREVYEERLEFGIAREQARCDLPLNLYTSKVWSMDLHNLLHFLRLRLDSHAQLEIRLYAEALAQIVKAWVPTVWEAFEDYVLYSQSFTRMEMKGLETVLQAYLATQSNVPYQQAVESLLAEAVGSSGLPKGREQTEFRDKIKKLLKD